MGDERISLTGPLDVVTASGQAFRIQAVQGGKGIAIIPLDATPSKTASSRAKAPRAKAAGTGGTRGRPPNPSTLQLRDELAKDAGKGRLHSAGHYYDLMRRWDPKGSVATQRQIVYRELGAAKAEHPDVATEESPGPKAKPVTQALRSKLEADAQQDALKDAQHYIKWVIKQDGSIGLKAARQLVYRERRRVANG